jgi:hypothetical protein
VGAAALSAASIKLGGKMLLRSCTTANSELLGRERLGELACGVAGSAASNFSKLLNEGVRFWLEITFHFHQCSE